MRARDNPYRAERLHALAFRFAGADWESLWTRLGDLGGQGCVVGPKGSGKTTLLLELAAFLRGKGMTVRRHAFRTDETVSREDLDQFVESLDGGGLLILDGADLLGPLQWRRIKNAVRGGRGLIASSHRRPLLPVLYRCRPTPALLEDLIDQLHPRGGCGQPAAVELHARHGGNIREALRELFDFHAGLRDGCR